MDKQGVPEAQDEMQKLMKEAVVMVRGQADRYARLFVLTSASCFQAHHSGHRVLHRMETDVITPMYDSYQQLAKDHPALAVRLH